MSFYQFQACVYGYHLAKGGERKLEAPSVAEFADMVERLG